MNDKSHAIVIECVVSILGQVDTDANIKKNKSINKCTGLNYNTMFGNIWEMIIFHIFLSHFVNTDWKIFNEWVLR